MLLVLLIQALYLLIFLPIGLFTVRAIAPTVVLRCGDRFVLAFWIAILLCGNLLTLVSFAVPLSPLAAATAVVPLCGFALTRSSTRKDLHEILSAASGWGLLSFSLLWLVLSFFATLPSYGDTGAYHFPVVKWLSLYGTVPGLGLILYPAAVSTSWYPLSAPLNSIFSGVLENRCQGIVNGLAFLISVLHAALALRRVMTNDERSSDTFLLIAWLLVWPFLERITLMSVNTIAHVTIPTWAAIFVALYAPDGNNKASSGEKSGLFLVFSALVATIKVLTLPVVAFAAVWIAARGRASWQVSREAILLAVVSFLTPLIFSVITIGYPFFVSTALALPLPWTPPPSEVAILRELVFEYFVCIHAQICDLKGMSWLSRFAWDQRTLVAFLIAGIASLFALISKKNQVNGWIATALVLLGLSSGGVLLLRGPSLGYGLGWLALAPAAAWMSCGVRLQEKKTGVILLTCLVLVYPRLAVTRWGDFAQLLLVVSYAGFFLSPLVLPSSFHLRSPFEPRCSSTGYGGKSFLTTLLLLGFLAIGQNVDLAFGKDRWQTSRLIRPDLLFSIERCRYEERLYGDIKIWTVVKSSPQDDCECWSHELPCTGVHRPFDGVKLREPGEGLRAGFERIVAP